MTGPGAAAAPGPEPFFSVVTVALDAGERLARTAASVDGQTWRDLEHLVQDGGSRDGSLATLAPDPRRSVVVAPDRGIYDAMNRALERCRGRYVLFLNAGDCLADPGALAAVAAHAAAGQADLYYCDLRRADQGTVVRYPDHLSRLFLFRRPLCHQACFFARRVYRRLGGFDLGLRLAADYDFLLRAVAGGVTARHLPEVAVVYEGGGLSALASSRGALAEEARRVRARHFTLAERLRYGAAVALTLRPLRAALFRHEALRGLRPLYQRVANAWNRASWPRRRGRDGADP